MATHATGESTEAVLVASRALVGVIARSLSPVMQHTHIADYRMLVVLGSRGRTDRRDLSAHLGAPAMTVDESMRRLSLGGMVTAAGSTISITPRGKALVDEVTERRRREIAHLLGELDEDARKVVATGFRLFAEAAGEAAAEEMLILGL